MSVTILVGDGEKIVVTPLTTGVICISTQAKDYHGLGVPLDKDEARALAEHILAWADRC